MAKMNFVGREQELVRIAEHASAWNTLRVLIVDGAGGIGKTSLLEEAYIRRQEYVDALHGQLKPTRVIGLDDIAIHIPMNLARRIANELGATRFQDYIGRTDRIIFYQGRPELTREAFRRDLHDADVVFVTTFNALTKSERVLLLLDGFEAVADQPLCGFLVSLIARLENTFVLIAGRNMKPLEQAVQQALDQAKRQDAQVAYMQLEPFSPDVAQAYLHQMPSAAYIESQPYLLENLQILTQGRPLLLALAGEWLHQDRPLPELTIRTPAELRALTPDEMKHLQAQFERALVERIRTLRAELAELILKMAHMHLRFDDEILAALENLSREDSKQRMRALQDNFFIKTRAEGSIALQDEMQRLVSDYVWRELDPFGTQRRHLSEQAVQHYQVRLDDLDKALAAQEQQMHAAEERQDIATAAAARREYLTQKRLQWLLLQELLHYTLDADRSQGYALFVREFDRATAQAQFSARWGLVRAMEKYHADLAGAPRYEVDIRLAQHYSDEAEYAKAEEILQNLDQGMFSPSQHIRVLIQLANVEIRLGDFTAAQSDFEEAVRLSQANGLTDWLIKAKNGLGWTLRLMGERDSALGHYEEAKALCLESGNLGEDYGFILNNLAFVFSYRDRSTAIAYGIAAVKYWEQTQNKVGLGAAYSMLGSVYYQGGSYDLALESLNKARDIFEPDYPEWMATIYSWRGAAYEDMGKYDQAEADLNKSLKIGPRHLEAMTLNRLGRVYMARKDWVRADNYLRQSCELAMQIPDYQYWLGSLARRIVLAAQQRQWANYHEWDAQLRECLGRIKSPDGNSLGIAHIALGRLALGNQEIERGIDLLKDGIRLVTEYGPYAHTDVTKRMAYLEEDFAHLPVAVIQQVGRALKQFCLERQTAHPIYGVLLPTFYRWAVWQAKD